MKKIECFIRPEKLEPVKEALNEKGVKGVSIYEVKGHGTQKLVEGLKNVGGKSVVILEDVVTTGNSAFVGINALKEEGMDVKGLITVVDREEGGADTFKKANIPFFSLLTKSDIIE